MLNRVFGAIFSGFSAGADMFSWNVAITTTSLTSTPFENNENNAETVQSSVPVHTNSATDTYNASATSYEQFMQVRLQKVIKSGSWHDGVTSSRDSNRDEGRRDLKFVLPRVSE